VVSSHNIQGGIGSPDARCRRDHTRRQKATTTADVVARPPTTTSAVVTQGGTTTGDVVTPRVAPLSSTNPATPMTARPALAVEAAS
jgi:hypothetical protein